MDIQKVKDALKLAIDYINDGSLLSQDTNHPYFKTSNAIDEAIAELDKSANEESEPDDHATDEAWWVARKVYDGIKANLSILPDTYVFNPFASACLIQQYAEAYHAERCKEESDAILAASNRLEAALDESDKVR